MSGNGQHAANTGVLYESEIERTLAERVNGPFDTTMSVDMLACIQILQKRAEKTHDVPEYDVNGIGHYFALMDVRDTKTVQVNFNISSEGGTLKFVIKYELGDNNHWYAKDPSHPPLKDVFDSKSLEAMAFNALIQKIKGIPTSNQYTST